MMCGTVVRRMRADEVSQLTCMVPDADVAWRDLHFHAFDDSDVLVVEGTICFWHSAWAIYHCSSLS